MTDERRERRREQALDLLNAWAEIGVFGRLFLTLAIIAGVFWLALQVVGLIGWLSLAIIP